MTRSAHLSYKDEQDRPWGLAIEQIQTPPNFTLSQYQEANLRYADSVFDRVPIEQLREFTKLLFWNFTVRSALIGRMLTSLEEADKESQRVIADLQKQLSYYRNAAYGKRPE